MAGDSSSNARLPLDVLRRIDELCDGFEAALRAGRRIDPATLVNEVTEAARGDLIRHLLSLDLDYANPGREAQVISTWLRLFPGYRQVIEKLAAKRKQSTGTVPPASPAGGVTVTAPNPVCESTLVPEETGIGAPGAPPQSDDTYRLAAAPRQKFGDYELLEEIARGGMGVVYRARQLRLNRIVALKMILAGNLASATDVERFYSEARAAGDLQHPNIVVIHEVGQHDGQHFFSMDYVDGPSLADKLVEGTWPPRDAARLVRQIARAIHYAHTRGIIHRDLKPRNVLLTAEGQPRITDFGLAKRLHGTSGLTASGQILGTPSFMSPEQAQGKVRGVGPRSDVYSLGAILYWLLTGRPPFSGRDAIEVLKRVIEREPTSPRRLNRQLDKDLETITLKCLQKDPAERYSSARELADDLNRFLKNEPIHSRPVGRSEKLWRWCRRKPLVASLMAAVGLLVILLLLTGSVVYSLWPKTIVKQIPVTQSRIPVTQSQRFAGSNPRATGQRADPNFDVSVPQPAYKHQVLFDEAHNNFHTVSGRYKAFADLITNDGYHITPSKEPFTEERLASYNLLITANAPATSGPSRSAFTASECDSVVKWVRAGGSLLLITDHEPWVSGSEELGKRFGVDMSLRKTEDPANQTENGLLFSREKNQLGDHPILRGRNDSERVDRVLTFVGQSLKGPPGSVDLLKFSDTAEDVRRRERRSAAGRAQGIAFKFGQGRVVVLGEAGALSAQVRGNPPIPMGMNVPGCDNRKLVLNIAHWLSGLTE
jgi:serine/threonine protein kinase